MSSPIPPEMFGEIFSHLRDDKVTLRAVRGVCRQWAFLSQEVAFARLVFKDQQHIAGFFDLASAPFSTIPKVLKCDEICFGSTGTIGDGLLLKMCGLMATIIHCWNHFSPAVHHFSVSWKENIRRLNLTGGSHSASTFFEFIGSFTRLKTLALRSLRMEGGDSLVMQYAFPSTMTELYLSNCGPLWTFLRSRVLPGGGLASVKDLYIQDLFFGGEPGVMDMKECFRGLNGICTVTLDPVYHDTLSNFNFGVYDIYRRSWEATLLQMGGLTHLRINCANLPPKFAMEYVGMYALQFASRLIETVVEVYFPHACESWNSKACDNFQEVFNAMRDFHPSTTGSSMRNLVVRGMPDILPNGVMVARCVTVCGQPIIFKETDWEEVMGRRLDWI